MKEYNKLDVVSKFHEVVEDVLSREIPVIRENNAFRFLRHDEVEAYFDRTLDALDGNVSALSAEVLYTVICGSEIDWDVVPFSENDLYSYYDTIESEFIHWFDETYVNPRFELSTGALLTGTIDDVNVLQSEAAITVEVEMNKLDVSYVKDALKSRAIR